MRKEAVLILAGVFCLALFRPVFSQEVIAGQAMTAEQLTANISQKWNNIQDFQSDMTVGVRVSGKMTKIEGAVWQKERVFRAEMMLPSEIMKIVTGYNQMPKAKALMVFDGKTMWFLLPETNMMVHDDFSNLRDDKVKNAPFSKPFYSLPAVSYQLSEKKRNGNDYYFLETKDTEGFIKNSPVAGLVVNLPKKMSFQRIGVWVNKDTLFPDLFEFYDQKSAPVMYAEFKDVKTDQGLSSKLFVFQAPKDVMDMTEAMKMMAGKTEKQSTVSDKTQAATAPDTGQAPK